MEQSLELLYLEYNDRIYRFILFRVRQKELAEDLTQETFYRAIKNIHSFNKQSSMPTWLLKIARNATYDHFRRKRIIQFFGFGKDEIEDSNASLPEDELMKKDGASPKTLL